MGREEGNGVTIRLVIQGAAASLQDSRCVRSSVFIPLIRPLFKMVRCEKDPYGYLILLPVGCCHGKLPASPRGPQCTGRFHAPP